MGAGDGSWLAGSRCPEILAGVMLPVVLHPWDPVPLESGASGILSPGMLYPADAPSGAVPLQALCCVPATRCRCGCSTLPTRRWRSVRCRRRRPSAGSSRWWVCGWMPAAVRAVPAPLLSGLITVVVGCLLPCSHHLGAGGERDRLGYVVVGCWESSRGFPPWPQQLHF